MIPSALAKGWPRARAIRGEGRVPKLYTALWPGPAPPLTAWLPAAPAGLQLGELAGSLVPAHG